MHEALLKGGFMAGNGPPPRKRPYDQGLKALLNPYFWGGYVRGGWLNSHDVWIFKHHLSYKGHSPNVGFEHPRGPRHAVVSSETKLQVVVRV